MSTTTGAPWNLTKPEGTDPMSSIADLVAQLADDVDAALDGTVPAWTGLTFAANWANYGAGFATVAYCKVGDVVRLRGLANPSGGAGAVIGTLPVGFRPVATEMFGPIHNGTAARLDITAAGAITLTPAPAGYVTLSGIAFRVV